MEAPKSDLQKVAFEIEHDFRPTGKLTSLRVFVGIPKTVDRCQHVINLYFTPHPIAVYDDMDTRYAIFQFSNLSENVTIKMKGDIQLQRQDLVTALTKSSTSSQTNFKPLSHEEKNEFLKSEKYIEVNDPGIKRIADTIEGPKNRLGKMSQPPSTQDFQTAEIETVQEVLGWLRRNVKYDAESRPEGAVATAKLGRGVCQQFSELFVTLCRSKGLPTRYVGGLSTYFDKRNPNSSASHAWAEVFLSGLGWVPFDPTWMESTSDVVKPIYISLTKIRNNVSLGFGNDVAWQYRYQSPVEISVLNSFTFRALTP